MKSHWLTVRHTISNRQTYTGLLHAFTRATNKLIHMYEARKIQLDILLTVKNELLYDITKQLWTACFAQWCKTYFPHN